MKEVMGTSPNGHSSKGVTELGNFIGIFMSQVLPESYYAAVDDFWVQGYQSIED